MEGEMMDRAMRLNLPLKEAHRHADYALVFTLNPPTGEVDHVNFRAPRTLTLQTNNVWRHSTSSTLEETNLILEEHGVFGDEKDQGADCASAGTTRVLRDFDDRISLDSTCDMSAWHEKFDNKACEWKSKYTIQDFVDRCVRRSEHLNTICWGCPLKGKCGADASGARFATRVRKMRRSEKLPTPENAMEIEAASKAIDHQPLSVGNFGAAYEARRKIKRSAMLGITKAETEIAKQQRGARTYKVKNLKMVRQLFYDHETKKVGTRFFRCACVPCMDRKFDACKAKAYTLGPPLWQ
eukprot:SAG11_NODE_177_length_13334_cov_9.614280_11_plen_296_part_00